MSANEHPISVGCFPEQERLTVLIAGLRELALWLRDQVRNGLSLIPGQPLSFWDGIIAHMIDAQAPGLARQLRRLTDLRFVGNDWPGRLLEQMARLYLLIEGFQRLETLPVEVQYDMRTAIGWPLSPNVLQNVPRVRDRWLVIGYRVEPETGWAADASLPSWLNDDRVYHHRTWLYGLESRQIALLNMATNSWGLHALDPGQCLDTEIALYPGSYPMRAHLETPDERLKRFRTQTVSIEAAETGPFSNVTGYASVGAAMEAYTAAMAGNPWLEYFPMALQAVVPHRHGDGKSWSVHDRKVIPLSARFERGWHLLALSGGEPVSLFGEWDGSGLYPLSAWAGGRYIAFTA